MTTSLNPADKGADVSISGSLTATATSGTPESIRGSTSNTTGKWYFEALIVAKASFVGVGLADAGFSVSSYLLSGVETAAYYDGGAGAVGSYSTGGGFGVVGVTNLSVGNVVGFAVDFDAAAGSPRLYFARNNVWQNSGDPASGTGYLGMSTAAALFPALTVSGDGASPDTITINLGATALTYTPPSGFSSWDTLVTSTGYPSIIMY